MDKKRLIVLINVLLLLVVFALIVVLQQKPTELVRVGAKHKYTCKQENNDNCLKCHAGHKYKATNPDDSTQVVSKWMFNDAVIDTVAYYHSNHYDFKCIDCHSEDYKKTPHNPALKFEEVSACIDCHGEDENYAKFHFDSINVDYGKSVHVSKLGKDFSCYSCHDAHGYKTHYRDSLKTINQVIEYANNMCMSCHSSNEKMKDFGKVATDMQKAHNWLPNQELHYQNMRCIECHAQSNPNMNVAHNILPEEKAIKNCEVCHSPNSTALNDLYLSRKSKESEKLGFTHPELTNYVSVIRANDNVYFDIIAASIIVLMIIGLTVHIVLRIKLQKKNGK